MNYLSLSLSRLRRRLIHCVLGRHLGCILGRLALIELVGYLLSALL